MVRLSSGSIEDRRKLDFEVGVFCSGLRWLGWGIGLRFLYDENPVAVSIVIQIASIERPHCVMNEVFCEVALC